MLIGEKLKEIRERSGMNKKEFAESIGFKYTTYNGYETGAREPDSDFLILISKKFNVSIDWILGLQNEKDIKKSYELKPSEFSYIEKYRKLDDSGRETINVMIEHEIKRVYAIRRRDEAIEILENKNKKIEEIKRRIRRRKRLKVPVK